MKLRTLAIALSTFSLLPACHGSTSPPLGHDGGTERPDQDVGSDEDASSDFVVTGADVIGFGQVDLVVRDGRIAAMDRDAGRDLPRLDATGKTIAPAFIDSHVHLAFRFSAEELAAGGVAAAVDLAAPIEFIAADHTPLQLKLAGPMVTAIGGYPTRSWGRNGYGAEVDGRDGVAAAVDRLADAGASVIKVPVGEAPTLDDAELTTVIERAHARGLKVVAHALADADARRAADAGADVLAHTPVQPLSEATVDAWSGRAVITTLDAFGGGAAVANLMRLRSAGATVLYGTDLGNTAIPAIDPNEIELLEEAGLTGRDILDAGTTTPAEFWGFEGLGTLDVGTAASFLVLDTDPRLDPSTLAEPEVVFINGVMQPQRPFVPTIEG